ncbi:MAG: hypothetical protein ACOCX0_02160 [Bacteroidota bacterium]
MKKITTTILSLLLATTFLLSFAGIRLLLHHCVACETTDVNLFVQNADCCTHSNGSASDASCELPAEGTASCCASQTSEEQCDNCCEDEIVYLKNDYELNKERNQVKVEPVALQLELSPINLLQQTVETTDEPAFVNYIPPPPSYVGKAFVLFTRQIKIG